MKFLNKWLRKIHRWLVIPFVTLIVVLIFIRLTPVGSVVQRVQQAMILLMAITGSYMFLQPYLVRWRRARRSENPDE